MTSLTLNSISSARAVVFSRDAETKPTRVVALLVTDIPSTRAIRMLGLQTSDRVVAVNVRAGPTRASQGKQPLTETLPRTSKTRRSLCSARLQPWLWTRLIAVFWQ